MKLLQLKKKKVTGTDGHPIDFYKTFWYDIKYLLCSVYNSSLLDNILPLSMRKSIITLLPKKVEIYYFSKVGDQYHFLKVIQIWGKF